MKINKSGIHCQTLLKKDYTTTNATGATIDNPETISYLNNNHHFCRVIITGESIEYLKLQRSNHIRALFTKQGNSWNGEFLVP